MRTGFSPGSINFSRDEKASPGIEELGLVAEKTNCRPTHLVAEILMDKQIDGSLAEGYVIGGSSRAPQAAGVYGKRMVCMAGVETDQRLPGLDEIFFRHGRHAVGPPCFGGIIGLGFAIHLKNDDGSLSIWRKSRVRAECQNARSCRNQLVLLFVHTRHLSQKFDVRQLFVPTGAAFRVALPVPADSGFVEKQRSTLKSGNGSLS
ncbi:MAG: hypothetical protein WDM70_05220 [Nitrosomonadales bacterium]